MISFNLGTDLKISGILENTGHGAVLNLLSAGGLFSGSEPNMAVPLNVSGGPLQYRYRFTHIHFHYGMNDDVGSEHLVAGRAFPAEVSIANTQISVIKLTSIFLSLIEPHI